MDSQYDEIIEEIIPGTVVVFALTDTEKDEEAHNALNDIDDFELPDHCVHGRRAGGGVCACALKNVLQKGRSEHKTITWAESLAAMHHEITHERGLTSYVPTLSSSRPIDLWEPMELTSPRGGTKRALLVGVHYEEEGNEDAQLTSCHDDIRKLRQYLIHEEGFEKRNILVSMDDGGRHHTPTKEFIYRCLMRLCQVSEPGDSIFLLFSGHGGRLMMEDENEDGIASEFLAPADYRDTGVLLDDELYDIFTTQVPKGVHVVAVVDTCHPPPSGGKVSALELPYLSEAGENEFHHSEGFTPGRMILASLAAGVGGATALAASKKKKKKKKKEKKEKKKKKKKKDKSTAEMDTDDDDHEDPSDGATEKSSSSEKEKSSKSKSTKKKKTSSKSVLTEDNESEKEKKKKKKDSENDEKKKKKKKDKKTT